MKPFQGDETMRTIKEIQEAKNALLKEEAEVLEARREEYREAMKDWEPIYDWSIMGTHKQGSLVKFSGTLSKKSRDEQQQFRDDFGLSPGIRSERISSVCYGWTPVPGTTEGPNELGVIYHAGGGTHILGKRRSSMYDDPTIFCRRCTWAALSNLIITPNEFNEDLKSGDA